MLSGLLFALYFGNDAVGFFHDFREAALVVSMRPPHQDTICILLDRAGHVNYYRVLRNKLERASLEQQLIFEETKLSNRNY